MPVPAVTDGGSLTVSSGSMTATHDAMCGVPPTLNLIFRLGSVITAHRVTSLPVPAVVGTAIMGGIRDSIGLWPHSYSTMLPLCARSEEHTSELQSQSNIVCRLLLEKKKKKN